MKALIKNKYKTIIIDDVSSIEFSGKTKTKIDLYAFKDNKSYTLFTMHYDGLEIYYYNESTKQFEKFNIEL